MRSIQQVNKTAFDLMNSHPGNHNLWTMIRTALIRIYDKRGMNDLKRNETTGELLGIHIQTKCDDGSRK